MTNVYIAITTERGQLTIDGPLYNLSRLLDALHFSTQWRGGLPGAIVAGEVDPSAKHPQPPTESPPHVKIMA